MMVSRDFFCPDKYRISRTDLKQRLYHTHYA